MDETPEDMDKWEAKEELEWGGIEKRLEERRRLKSRRIGERRMRSSEGYDGLERRERDRRDRDQRGESNRRQRELKRKLKRGSSYES